MKRTSAVCVAVAVAALAVGCGGDSSPSESSGDEPARITFASTLWEQSGRGDAIWDVVSKFNDVQDAAVVEQSSIPFSGYEQQLFTQLGAGTGPDVMFLNYAPFLAAVDAGFLEPLDDLDLGESADNLVPQTEFARVDETLYGLVFLTNHYALIANKALFDEGNVEYPTDFDSFVEAAKELTDAPGQYGFAARHTEAEAAGWWFDLTNFVYGFGGRWSSDDGEPTVNSDAVVRGVEAFKKVYDAEVIPQGADAATYRRMAWEGKVAMMIDNASVPQILASENPDMTDDIVALPIPFPEPEHAMIVGFIAINSASPHKEEAAALVEHLFQPETQEELLIALAGNAVGTKIGEVPQAVLDAVPWYDTYQEVSEWGVPEVPIGFEATASQFSAIVIEEVAKAMAGSISVPEAMDTAQARIEDELS